MLTSHVMPTISRFLRGRFYNKYPYRGNLRPYIVDSRGAFDLSLKIFYNRIPKVANSSIMHFLAEARYGNIDDAIAAKRCFKLPSQMTSSDVSSLDDVFKFAFVRNPYTRILSAYLDKVVRRRYFDVDGKYPGVIHSKRGSPPSFSVFCEYLMNGGLYVNAHWAPQVDLLLLPIEMYDYLGRFESIDSDMQYVARALGITFNGMRSMGPPKTTAYDLLSEYYGKNEYRMISELYFQDFQRFEYAHR